MKGGHGWLCHRGQALAEASGVRAAAKSTDCLGAGGSQVSGKWRRERAPAGRDKPVSFQSVAATQKRTGDFQTSGNKRIFSRQAKN